MDKRSVERPTKDALSQNDLAYITLRDKLIDLSYRPGEYLNTATLIDELKLGRTPINHALHRLEMERLIQILPRKGVIVAPLSIDDAMDLIEVRLANEVLCVRLATERITAEELAEIERICCSFRDVMDKRDIRKIMELDRSFHEAIASASRNPILIDILKVVHGRAQRFWALSFENEGHLQEIAEEHEAVLKAMNERSADAAAEAIRTHINSFRSSMMNSSRR
ncbi:GntR family transcriptional regulator [Rhizobium sp. CNPSo 4039]|uniref:GntR family transcriptional regulator n=1 Tax=Rhizobium sp. CNPSo 4039 TaxID=3021409 RepID=UPI00254FDE02|nr:GntR family transcriptional regulator [Rhizobium sp. CNPSo 4039]MDK4716007.1 GntR family transcriptional regulator [Rhizobium sp. CNPSo 4039]